MCGLAPPFILMAGRRGEANFPGQTLNIYSIYAINYIIPQAAGRLIIIIYIIN